MRPILIAALLAIATTAFAAQPRDYSGGWTFDRAASEGLPQQYADVKEWTLDVTQDAKLMSVKVNIASSIAERPPMQQKFEYALDGSETSTTTQIFTPNGAMDIPTFHTARVTENGALEITIVREVPVREEKRRITTDERWELDATGKVLTVHMKSQQRNGTVAEFDVVFRKG